MIKTISEISKDIRKFKNLNELDTYFFELKTDFRRSIEDNKTIFINNPELYFIEESNDFMRTVIENPNTDYCMTLVYTGQSFDYGNKFVQYKIEYQCKYIDYIIDFYKDRKEYTLSGNGSIIEQRRINFLDIKRLGNALEQKGELLSKYSLMSTEISHFITTSSNEDLELLVKQIEKKIPRS